MRAPALLAIASILAGCRDAPKPAAADTAIPRAEDTSRWVDAPTITLDGDRVLLDGSPAGDTRAIEAGHAQRVPELREALFAKRNAWKTHAKDAPFPGIVAIEAAGRTRADVVKRLFHTAAYAGYPSLCIVVEPALGADPLAPRACVDLDAQVPGPTGIPVDEIMKTLHVEVHAPDKFVLEWRKDRAAIARTEAPRKEVLVKRGSGEMLTYPDLAAAVLAAWRAHGDHNEPGDRAIDQAAVHVRGATDLRQLVAVIDAIRSVKRAIKMNGPKPTYPALGVTLAFD